MRYKIGDIIRFWPEENRHLAPDPEFPGSGEVRNTIIGIDPTHPYQYHVQDGSGFKMRVKEADIAYNLEHRPDLMSVEEV